MSDSFNGARLESLRHIHGMSQGEFGKRLSLSQSRLSRIERGDLPLTGDIVADASREFGEPISFFRVPLGAVPLGPVAYRRRSSASAVDKKRLVTLFEDAARVFYSVSERSGYHEFAPIGGDDSPEGMAESVRAVAGLTPDQPVRNVTRLIERLGVGVVTNLDDDEHVRDITDVSGIAMPTARNMRPLIATNPIARGDVQRLTLAHEFGHVLLDRGAATISCSTRSPQERSAFRFGAALLLPTAPVRRTISERSTLRDYLELKGAFGISASAAVARAHTLGLITDDRKRTLSIQLSSRGWRYDEPVDVAVEKPLLLAQALAKSFPTSTYARASHELGVRPERLRRWAARPEEERDPTPITPLRTIRPVA